jgi:hypothetical protein
MKTHEITRGPFTDTNRHTISPEKGWNEFSAAVTTGGGKGWIEVKR